MPARIVVVHDDPQFIELSMTALLGAGHDIKAFSSSQEGCNWLTDVIGGPGLPRGESLCARRRPIILATRRMAARGDPS
jgi:hypothetical protein